MIAQSRGAAGGAGLADLAPGAGRPAGADPLAIDARGVRKAFDDHVVLEDLTVQIRAGEIFGLIGPSGSGKSTTINLLTGQLAPDGGTIAVLGEDPAHFSTATRRRLGFMAQGFIFYPELTVEENVAFAAGLYGLPEWRARDHIRAVLELVELWDARKRAARATSGGMKRRIALAAALVHDPDLLFVDEPTANLDPILRAKLWGHFRRLADRGRTLVVTTQYVDEAEHCDRVGLMHEGGLIATGPPDELQRAAFGGDIVNITVERPLPRYVAALNAVEAVRRTEAGRDEPLRVTVDAAERAIPALVEALEDCGATIGAVAPYQPTFDEVFIRLIERRGRRPPPDGAVHTSAGAGEGTR